ncbi:hypothetical protein, partial [Methylogaea oryzae]|uniref:hypothetical protein n=1 Tax=Methylogaea oryzae TaxID=1295382 RepID=UPI001C3F349E
MVGGTIRPVAGLYFLSGAGALLYEVCWMRALGLLFGAGSQAAAVTLTAFFLGLAAGSAYWSAPAGRAIRPLRLYGGLELVAALSACLYFVLPDAYRLLYPWLFERWQADFAWLLTAKFCLALAGLFPSAFCMGGHCCRRLSRCGGGAGVVAAVRRQYLGRGVG